MKISKKIKLPKVFRKKWLEMLTSGNYKQIKETLTRKGAGYCCLGVAGRALNIRQCDMKSVELPAELKKKFAKKFPKALVETIIDEYDEKNNYMSNTNFTSKLADLNDFEKSFKEIAAYIRSNTIGV